MGYIKSRTTEHMYMYRGNFKPRNDTGSELYTKRDYRRRTIFTNIAITYFVLNYLRYYFKVSGVIFRGKYIDNLYY